MPCVRLRRSPNPNRVAHQSCFFVLFFACQNDLATKICNQIGPSVKIVRTSQRMSQVHVANAPCVTTLNRSQRHTAFHSLHYWRRPQRRRRYARRPFQSFLRGGRCAPKPRRFSVALLGCGRICGRLVRIAAAPQIQSISAKACIAQGNQTLATKSQRFDSN